MPEEVDENFDEDNRTVCAESTDVDGNSYYEFDLLCVDSSDSCEKPQ